MGADNVKLFDQAFAITSNLAGTLSRQSLALQAAQGRVLAEPVYAETSLPPFSRAMMDGFAVRTEDLSETNKSLQIVGSVQAGLSVEAAVGPGEAIQIATGAPVPSGANAIARHEWCNTDGDTLTVLRPVLPGESVQPQGEDGRNGAMLLPAGTVLHGEQLAVCQGFGVDSVTVFSRPRVRILITGDEVAPNPGAPLKPGQVYSVNDMFLRLHLMEDGCDVPAPTFVRDDPGDLANALNSAALDADFVITTGGVSVGHRDYMAGVLENLNATIALRKVLMRPGSPLLAGKLGQTIVYSLSGNPAAAFIQFETLVRPAVRRAMGRSEEPFGETAKLVHDLNLKPIKPVRILRGQARINDAEVWVDTRVSQSSGVISSLGNANCLIRIEEGTIPAGATVPLRWFRHG